MSGISIRFCKFLCAGMAASAFAAAASAQPPESGSHFPTAGEYLSARGLDPSLVQEIAKTDVPIRVMTRAGFNVLIERVQAAYDADQTYYKSYLGTLRDKLNHFSNNDKPASYRSYDLVRGWFNFRFNEFESGECYVSHGDELVRDQKKFLSLMSWTGTEYFERTPIPQEQVDAFVLFHELRHCTNQDLHSSEADSDIAAANLVAKIYNNPVFPHMIMLARALGPFGGDHNTSLFMDSFAISGAFPDSEDIRTAEGSLMKRVKEFGEKNPEKVKGKSQFLVRALALHDISMNLRQDISHLEKRRLDLFMEGMAIYMPNLYRQIQTDIKPAKVSGFDYGV